MGVLLSKVFSRIFGWQKEVRVLVLGLDNAGKTTILYKLHSPNVVMRTMPTIGFNVETIKVKNLTFQGALAANAHVAALCAAAPRRANAPPRLAPNEHARAPPLSRSTQSHACFAAGFRAGPLRAASSPLRARDRARC
jgi:hypothetical protein